MLYLKGGRNRDRNCRIPCISPPSCVLTVTFVLNLRLQNGKGGGGRICGTLWYIRGAGLLLSTYILAFVTFRVQRCASPAVLPDCLSWLSTFKLTLAGCQKNQVVRLTFCTRLVISERNGFCFIEIGAVKTKLCVIICKGSGKNFCPLLNRKNGTYSVILRVQNWTCYSSGTVWRTKMELSPNCWARNALSCESVNVYRTVLFLGTTLSNCKREDFELGLRSWRAFWGL